MIFILSTNPSYSLRISPSVHYSQVAYPAWLEQVRLKSKESGWLLFSSWILRLFSLICYAHSLTPSMLIRKGNRFDHAQFINRADRKMTAASLKSIIIELLIEKLSLNTIGLHKHTLTPHRHFYIPTVNSCNVSLFACCHLLSHVCAWL